MENYRHGDTASWNTEHVRRASGGSRVEPPKKRRKRRRRRMNPILYILLVLVTSTVLAYVGWMLITDLCAFNKPYTKIEIEVTHDDTVETVADKLEAAGLIEYKWFFRLFGNFAHAEENIGVGVHELTTDMDYRALIVGMRSSSGGNMNAETVQVTIPEGYTVAQTIALLAEKGVNTEEKLLDAAQNYAFEYDFIDNKSKDISRLEGYLFPDTYEFYVGEKASSALNRLISTFNKRVDDELLAASEAAGYGLDKITIIASLIEKETDGSDHAKIASVIYNRLAGGGGTYGMLQIDAALLYALPNHTGGITNADKEVDSPYNLYKYEGLPPTPIANPGKKSLDAALKPESTDYYYYALGKDGHHRFFKTYEEHLNFLNSSEYVGN